MLTVLASTDADGVTRIRLSGRIDEEASLDGVFPDEAERVVLKLSAVDRVNSVGIHRWIPAVAKYTRGRRVLVEQISYALALNASTVKGLFGEAAVTSCMAPYFCGKCEENFMVLVRADEVPSGSTPGAPEKACERCARPMEFDELDNYFRFFRLYKTS